MADKRTIYVGGLADDVTEKLINDAFIPFGDIADIQMPVDYESQKHRGFAFIEYESAEDAAAAIDNMVRTSCHFDERETVKTIPIYFVERCRAHGSNRSREYCQTTTD